MWIIFILLTFFGLLTITNGEGLIMYTLINLIICASIDLSKVLIYKVSIKRLKWKYKIGDKLIYRQQNCYYDRLIGCEIISQEYSKKFSKRNTPIYKVKAYTESNTVWHIEEDDFLCTAKEFGKFPDYTEMKKVK